MDNLISFARWEVGLCILIRLALSDRHCNVYMLSCERLYLFNRVEYISPRHKRCTVKKHSDTSIMLIRKPLFCLRLIVNKIVINNILKKI